MATVLAIESSCDETACAVVEDMRVLSSVVSTQIEVHAPFGGVVPELASRSHLEVIVPVVREAMQRSGLHDLGRIDALAVTEGPGLVGALLVGTQVARGLAAAHGLPLIGIHHMEGHIFSAFLGDENRESEPFTPHLALLVSGGHTELVYVEALGRYTVLGATRDDAVGEAYDKVSKSLGLGYPGGPVIDRFAAEGNPAAIAFPRSMITHPGFDFSFSGLKTAVMVHVDRHGQPQSREALTDLCASFQAAAVEVLVAKTVRARRELGCDRVHVVGGVAANRGLQAAMAVAAEAEGFRSVFPPLRYCGDNAAMIAAAAAARLGAGASSREPAVDVRSSIALDDDRLRAE
jgi:N6-L-threonylcarbamoyladenine synthase